MAHNVRYHGHHSYILIGRETDYGTAVTADKDVGFVQDVSPSMSNNLTRIQALSSTDTQAITAGAFSITGSIKTVFQHGRLLEYITGGTVSHDETGTPDIKHTYTFSDSLPSFTLEHGLNATSDAVSKYAGTMLQNLELHMADGGTLEATANFLAKTAPFTTSAGSAVIDSLEPFPSSMQTLSLGTDASESAVELLSDFTFTIDRGSTATEPGSGTRLSVDAQAMRNAITFKGTVGWREGTNRDMGLFLDGTPTGASPDTLTPDPSSMLLNITNGVAAASGLRQVNIDTGNNVYYNSFPPSTPVGDWIIYAIEGFVKATPTIFTYDDITTGNWG